MGCALSYLSRPAALSRRPSLPCRPDTIMKTFPRQIAFVAWVGMACVVVEAASTTDAQAATEDKSVSVAPKVGGGLAFFVPSAGPIKVNVSAPSAVKVRLVGPKGDVSTKGPATSIDLTTDAKEDDIALGKGWAVVIAPLDTGKSVTAQIKIDHPGAAMTDKDVNRDLDNLTRAASRVPLPLPASTPLMPDAASVARIVSAKIPNAKPNVTLVGSAAILRTAKTLHETIPRPPSGTAKGTSSSSNNYGGAPVQAQAGHTFVSIASIDLSNDDDPARVCAANCAIRAGDVITFTLAPGSEKLAHEVHFVFFDADADADKQRDVSVRPVEWKDDVRKVSVQMPRFGPEVFDKLGAIYLGTPNGQATSTFWAFKYDPTISLFLPLDPAIHAAPAKVFTTVSPSYPEYAYHGPFDNKTRYTVTRGSAIGTTGHDTFLSGVTLKNGWLVKKVERQVWASSLAAGLQVGHALTEVHEGTSNATVGVDWSYDPGTTLHYTLGLKVQGRDGTLPF